MQKKKLSFHFWDSFYYLRIPANAKNIKYLTFHAPSIARVKWQTSYPILSSFAFCYSFSSTSSSSFESECKYWVIKIWENKTNCQNENGKRKKKIRNKWLLHFYDMMSRCRCQCGAIVFDYQFLFLIFLHSLLTLLRSRYS